MERKGLSDAERLDWLRLSRTQNVGPVAFRDLLRRYGSAGKALEALPDLLRGKRLKTPSVASLKAEVERAAELGIRYVAACEPDYPEPLSHIDPPPPVISVRGNISLLHKPCVAMVGSRNASALGRRFAAQLAGNLGRRGYVVVSGLALGIDASAHAAALGTGTVAVLGGGPDHVYPRQNADLYADIAERGAIVSESPLGYTAQARDFPRRNRIISGLSAGVVVVEAAERSGTLITARYAAEQGREVMACPGSPLDPRAKGCNRLLRQGATLVETADDVVEALEARPRVLLEGGQGYVSQPFDPTGAEDEVASAKNRLLSLASPVPTPRDLLIREAGLAAGLANAALLELELEGAVVVEPDGRISALAP